MFQNKVNHLGAVSLEYKMYIFKKMTYTEGGLLNYTRYWEDCNRPISCWSSTLDSLDTKLTMTLLGNSCWLEFPVFRQIWFSLSVMIRLHILTSNHPCHHNFSFILSTLDTQTILNKLCRHESSVIVSFNKRMLLSW